MLFSSLSPGRGPANRKVLIAHMAADLCRVGLPADEREAIRALCQLDYRHVDVAALAEDALFAARELAVTSAMTAEPTSSPTPPSLTVPKASQAPSAASVLAAPGPKDGGLLFQRLALLALEAPLTWRDPGVGA